MRIVTEGSRAFCWGVGVPDGVLEIRIVVSGEDDPARDERAARGLRDDLLALDDVVDAGFTPSDCAPLAGAKGPGTADTIVLVTTVAPSAAAIVIAFIRAWADRSSHRKVVVSADGSVEVHGGIGRREQQLVRGVGRVESDADARTEAEPVRPREDLGG